MLSQIYYVLRSKEDGRYLAARSQGEPQPTSYLLLFKGDAEALSYLNTHAPEVGSRFAVETIVGTQLGHLLERWGLAGIALVQDPLLPQVEFLTWQPR
ncbi:hypothetical protein BST81_05050 [Leptolyngbya sp. 'hensonii']|uniref:hypothetical protein n=1 Tax=Leptolyngbya sp. 'hensonii' TaxID=1922337 RepID=UPI00094F681A|nr:hypothetical protein [Leptolyngbya sp. 'hensonii']OLP19496.1 hypothetical protein BST81_05050 [Leptolyngbya sp. 'hensonii']